MFVPHLTRSLELPGLARSAEPVWVTPRGVRPEIVPEIGPVLPAQAEIELQVAAVLLLERPQHQPEALAVGIMHVLKKIADRDIQGAGLESKLLLDLVSNGNLVLAGVPLEDMGAGAVHGEGFHLHQACRTEAQW